MNAAPCWALVPAAGSGTRMGAPLPKQYLDLAGRSVLDHTLSRLLDCELFAGLVVVLAPDDMHWSGAAFAADPRVHTATGGATRSRSVLNGLHRLRELAPAASRVAVHDAVRPCVPLADLRALLAADCGPGGALLAVPVADTLKRADDTGAVTATVARDGIWRALTPQLFAPGALTDALEAALARGIEPTDEAQAMELQGQQPRLVTGSTDNIKITRPGDLTVAAALLGAAGPDG